MISHRVWTTIPWSGSRIPPCLEPILKAARNLERMGCKAIAAECGYFAWFQKNEYRPPALAGKYLSPLESDGQGNPVLIPSPEFIVFGQHDFKLVFCQDMARVLQLPVQPFGKAVVLGFETLS